MKSKIYRINEERLLKLRFIAYLSSDLLFLLWEFLDVIENLFKFLEIENK